MKKEPTIEPKLVLSRKGFDSDSGGAYSPFDSSTGKYIWLPIPERDGKIRTDAIKYNDVRTHPNYLSGYSQDNLLDLYNALFPDMEKNIILDRKKKRQKPIDTVFAHYDPMLGPGPWLAAEQPRTIGRGFGQTRQPLGHLRNQHVKEGSVFLFFGAFRDATEGITGHYIFGWMKVGGFIDTFADVADRLDEFGLQHHPHIKQKAFGTTKMGHTTNRIYLPAKHLFHDEELDVPGCGYFRTLDETLCLTQDPKAMNKMSWWELPGFYLDSIPWGVKKSTWRRLQNGRCVVQTMRGQELVTPLHAESQEWVRNIFLQNRSNLFVES